MAKNCYIGVDNKARKIKKCYVGVDGVAKQIKKTYVGVNGVARLIYTYEDNTTGLWKKYHANYQYIPAWYDQDNLRVGETYQENVWYDKDNLPRFYEGYTFSETNGFKGGAASRGGSYKVPSGDIVYELIHTSYAGQETDTQVLFTEVWECVASATYYPEVNNYFQLDYIETVENYPTEDVVHMPSQDLIYTLEDGSYYCYEKVIGGSGDIAVYYSLDSHCSITDPVVTNNAIRVEAGKPFSTTITAEVGYLLTGPMVRFTPEGSDSVEDTSAIYQMNDANTECIITFTPQEGYGDYTIYMSTNQ